MSRVLYSLFFYAIMPLVLLRLLLRGIRAPAYLRRIGERFGFFPKLHSERIIWLHSVSVGETIASAPLVAALREKYPTHKFLVTTMTPTGSERVRAIYGDSVYHVYAPYDLPGAVARFLDRAHPEVAVIVETEIWPNILAACGARDIPVALINARLSERSLRGYQRISTLAGNAIGSISRIIAQSEADAQRFAALGATPQQLTVSGSIKFDIEIAAVTQAAAKDFRSDITQAGKSLVWIAASTHEGEDAPVLAAHQALLQVYPQALLILVPRHPERFDDVAKLISKSGLTCQRRSEEDPMQPHTQVLLGDTMGELMCMFGAADIAFVGGSLVENGGHNMLEPAAWGLPVLTGQSDFNFAAISELLQAAGALQQVEQGAALGNKLLQLAADKALRRQRGDAARAVVEANRGALARVVDEVVGLL